MKLIARADASKRECSVQEAVYQIMPKLWLSKVLAAVLFANTNLPENRYRVCVGEKGIKQLPESSTYIFKTNYEVLMFLFCLSLNAVEFLVKPTVTEYRHKNCAAQFCIFTAEMKENGNTLGKCSFM